MQLKCDSHDMKYSKFVSIDFGHFFFMNMEQLRLLVHVVSGGFTCSHGFASESLCFTYSNFHPVNHRGVVIWQGRLLEQSRTAGILEGKIIASTEENKVSSLTRWRLWGNRWYGYGMMKQKMFSRISSNNSIIISSRWWQLKCFWKFWTWSLGKWSNLTSIFFEWVETTN